MVSDGASGIIRAIEECFPDRRASVASHTGCKAISRPRSRRIHGRNSRPGSQPAIRRPRGRLRAANWRPGIRADYANVLPSALACFEDDFESCIAHLRPCRSRTAASFAPPISSNGYSSRNGDGWKIIPNGFGEKPVAQAHVRSAHPGRRNVGAVCASPNSSCARSPQSGRTLTTNIRP